MSVERSSRPRFQRLLQADSLEVCIAFLVRQLFCHAPGGICLHARRRGGIPSGDAARNRVVRLFRPAKRSPPQTGRSRLTLICPS